MEDIKSTLIKIAVILLLIIIPVSLLSTFFTWFGNAIKWIVFIDNAETGLPMTAEIIIKGICEAIVASIAVVLGISKKNPFVTILSIIVSFLVCVGIYAICKYIVWIVAILAVLLAFYLIFMILRVKKEKKQEIMGSSVREN